MLTTDNKQYNNFLKEWEDLYNKTYGLNYYGKFPIYITDNLDEDIKIFTQDKNEIYKPEGNNLRGATLPPYKNRKTSIIFINKRTIDSDVSIGGYNSTFFHEYTHAIHFNTFCLSPDWDLSNMIYDYEFYDSLKLWSEAHSVFNGIMFINLLTHNSDITFLKEKMNNFHNLDEWINFFISELQRGFNSENITNSVIRFFGRYMFLEYFCPAKFKECNMFPEFLINYFGYNIFGIYYILNNYVTVDSILPALPLLNKMFKDMKFY